MNPLSITRRYLTFLLFFAFVISLAGPLGRMPGVEAATTSSAALVGKLRAQIARMGRQIARLKRELAEARAVPPTPVPFIEMAAVGNPGNAADPSDGDSGTAGMQNYGAVPYEFRIGKYEVTLAQYTSFLNAVAATDTFGLYNASMATDPNSAGITQSGTSGSFTYAVIGDGARPVTFVNWFDAVRFCNWLHNGRPTGAQAAATTENGAYPLNGATSGGLTITRNPGAKFWMPSEDEWYKAAYHDPRSAGTGGPPGDDNYWLYPTRSDTVPTEGTPSGTANLANFNFAVNALTPVGAYTGSAGFYGTFDQGGNVWEWEDVVIGSNRGLRGGSWDGSEFGLRSFSKGYSDPGNEYPDFGFRVASP